MDNLYQEIFQNIKMYTQSFGNLKDGWDRINKIQNTIAPLVGFSVPAGMAILLSPHRSVGSMTDASGALAFA